MNDKKASRIASLLRKRQVGPLNEAEERELRDWLTEDPSHAALIRQIDDPTFLRTETKRFLGYPADDVWDKAELRQAMQQDRRTLIKRLRWGWGAAAAVTALLAIGYFFLQPRFEHKESRLAATEILPGGNRATLTLADGRTINLSEAQQGIIVGNELSYTDGSEVIDAGKENLMSDVSHLMSLKTPKGGTYQITLPDGTTVWLNAASTLKYLSNFSRTARVVELSGEAYFDVEKNEMPFRVRSKGQEVEVLGTAFNISAYPDETETQTTLVAGSVRLALAASPGTRRSENVLTLVPGEQGRFQKGVLTKAIADVRSVTAWKDGRFAFTGKSFSQVMDEFSRWYDVDIRYDGKVPDEPLIGGAYRTDDFRTVLRLLESGGIAYRLEGRTLIINPKEEVAH